MPVMLLLMATLLIFTATVMNNYSASHGESVVAGFGIAFRVVQLAEFLAMGLFTAIFQATAKARQATAISILRGGLFIPVIMLGNHFLGLSGIIWSLAVTESLCFCAGAAMLFFLKKEISGMRAPAPVLAIACGQA